MWGTDLINLGRLSNNLDRFNTRRTSREPAEVSRENDFEANRQESRRDQISQARCHRLEKSSTRFEGVGSSNRSAGVCQGIPPEEKWKLFREDRVGERPSSYIRPPLYVRVDSSQFLLENHQSGLDRGFAARHDPTVWRCFCTILGIPLDPKDAKVFASLLFGVCKRFPGAPHSPFRQLGRQFPDGEETPHSHRSDHDQKSGGWNHSNFRSCATMQRFRGGGWIGGAFLAWSVVPSRCQSMDGSSERRGFWRKSSSQTCCGHVGTILKGR